VSSFHFKCEQCTQLIEWMPPPCKNGLESIFVTDFLSQFQTTSPSLLLVDRNLLCSAPNTFLSFSSCSAVSVNRWYIENLLISHFIGHIRRLGPELVCVCVCCISLYLLSVVRAIFTLEKIYTQLLLTWFSLFLFLIMSFELDFISCFRCESWNLVLDHACDHK
jgi:hypothetical protein